ncbi:flagellar basal-body MS-ring/collar protein FliF [Roseovarius sp. SCSIO 43702]|uniref:flagellar basal-body MS-ring/collar protein FliF n=1 Tax=Roseovarius sp. SCSIO 43702 TaxID=2823043 RepID=UPI0021759B43|nr:flagellar basal-body MS-ring/collar protein FliF [Roseovarius sp. SCSIO 43702]
MMNVWSGLDFRKRAIVIISTLLIFGAVLGLGRAASRPSLALLYSGLESGAAGEVVQALEQRGVAYDVRGGTIFVDAAQRDTLRLTLAAEGLPANTSKGYEILDGLNGFGTTSQMFDAAYWRAKEGELARTLVSSPDIATARVHLANTGSNPFQRDVSPSASVMVTSPGGGLPPRQAEAVRFLVASAIPGMTPEDVSVIDSAGGLIGGPDDTHADSGDDLTDNLRQRVGRLLEARVGPGNAVVEISVETVKTTELIREMRVDPESRVAISTDTEERSNASSDAGGGDVTIASNLPQGDGAGEQSSSSQMTETRERVNYEVSQTERQLTLAPGAIKRLTVAALVNGTETTDATGAVVFEPRPEEELAALRELVASAVGFDEARGDVITIKTMEFTPIPVAGTAAAPSWMTTLGLDLMSILQAAILAVVALALGLFVVRPLMSGARNEAAARLPSPAGPSGSGEPALRDGDDRAGSSLTGEIDDSDIDTSALALVPSGSGERSPGLSSLPARGAEATPDPVERLRAMIGERQDETVEILRTWLEGDEEKAT